MAADITSCTGDQDKFFIICLHLKLLYKEVIVLLQCTATRSPKQYKKILIVFRKKDVNSKDQLVHIVVRFSLLFGRNSDT